MHEMHAERMQLSETFQVAVMIKKLRPSWKDFKDYLKYKRNEMNLEDLIVRLQIEEENRFSKKKGNQGFQYKSKANIVEQGQSSNTKTKKFSSLGVKAKCNFKCTGKWYICDKIGHQAKDCRGLKNQGNGSKRACSSQNDRGESLQ